MKSAYLKKILITCSLALCSSSLVAFDYVNSSSNYKIENNLQTFNAITQKEVKGEYQFEKTFPIKTTDDKFDDSLLTNQVDTFYGYSDQGKILLKCENILDFKVFINGIELKINNFSSNDWNVVDISSITVNGNNKIQVSKVNVESKSTIDIKIPYPTLIDATDKYKNNDNLKLIDQIINAEI